MKAYEYLDHPADLGIYAFGRTPQELFENAARAVLDALADTDTVAPDQEYPVLAEASSSYEDLMVHLLSEIIYQHEVQEAVFREITVHEITPDQIRATARGEPIDPKKHMLYTEIKNVTYHQLFVRQEGETWEAQVILDL